MPYNVSTDVDTFLRSANNAAARTAISAASTTHASTHAPSGSDPLTGYVVRGTDGGDGGASLAVGLYSAAGSAGVAVGYGCDASDAGDYPGGNTAAGWGALANAGNSCAFGYSANVPVFSGSQLGGVAIGAYAISYGGISVGTGSTSVYGYSPASVAVGNQSNALSGGSVAIGAFSQAWAGVGVDETVSSSGIAIGESATSTNTLNYPTQGGVAIGAGSSADTGGISMGRIAGAGASCVSIGDQSVASSGGIAIGSGARAYDEYLNNYNPICIGKDCWQYAGNGIAIGSNTSLGYFAGSIAIGNNLNPGEEATVIGSQIYGVGGMNVTWGYGATWFNTQAYGDLVGQSANVPSGAITLCVNDTGAVVHAYIIVKDVNGTLYQSNSINLNAIP